MRDGQIINILWLIGVVLGVSYWFGAMARSGAAFHSLAALDYKLVVIWKLLSAGFLTLPVVITARSKGSKPLVLLAMALCVIVFADFLLAVKYVTISGLVFIIAHMIAMSAYFLARKKRQNISAAVRGLSMLIASLIIIMASVIIQTTDISLALAVFPIFSALAASFALRSQFPVHLTGLGAVIFMMSDVTFVLGSLGGNDAAHLGWIVWICYFTGLALITRGALRYGAAQFIHTP